jgi:hypothetical protein
MIKKCGGDGEIGLLKKVHNTGKKVIYNPNAIVRHFIPKSRLTLDYFKERAFKSGIEVGYTKYHYGSEMTIKPLKLIIRSEVFCIHYLAHKTVALLPFRNRVKHDVMSSYYKARCLYESKLSYIRTFNDKPSVKMTL